MSDPVGAEQTAILTKSQVLQGVRENFAVISGVIVVLGIGLATVFVSAYLTVFDWHLIWFVQYTDILTFGLIGVGVLGGSTILIQSFAQSVLQFKVWDDQRKWKGILIFLGFWAFFYILQMFLEHLRPEPHYQYITSAWLSIIAAISLIVTPILYYRLGMWPNAGQVLAIVISALFGALSFGQWLGYSVLYTSQFDQDVTFKGGTLNGAKLVATLSRNTILMKDGVVYVIPTADVTQFRNAAKRSP
jgi:hypothetical protein